MWYNVFTMDKTLLIAGKEIPDGDNFAVAAITNKRKVVITKNHTDENTSSPNGTLSIAWNRPSALSARSLILKTLNEFGNIDECVVIFDEQYFINKFGSLENSSENVRIIEELISSYQYLVMEIITRISKKMKTEILTSDRLEKRNLKLIFIHKTNPSLSECVLSKLTAKPSSIFISTASHAFKTYVENVSASLVENTEITPILVNCDYNNELASNDNALATWLFSYLETLDNLKRPLTAKQKISWVKAGSKSPGGFGFFN